MNNIELSTCLVKHFFLIRHLNYTTKSLKKQGGEK
nr:MAG TPA: hypothetical protein [Caudoviricetes sp.]